MKKPRSTRSSGSRPTPSMTALWWQSLAGLGVVGEAFTGQREDGLGFVQVLGSREQRDMAHGSPQRRQLARGSMP